MTNQVYLVAVSHSYQYSWLDDAINTKQNIKKFQDYLKSQVTKYKIDLIAQEWNTEDSQKHQITKSTSEEVALELNIEYLGCDPNRKERSDCGIDKQDTNKREQFWLLKLTPLCANRDRKILFILGEKHLLSFQSQLVRETNFQVGIISDNDFIEDILPR